MIISTKYIAIIRVPSRLKTKSTAAKNVFKLPLMKKTCNILLACLMPALLFAGPKSKNKENKGKEELTLEKIWASGTFYPKSMPGTTMLTDGTYCTIDYDAANKAYVILKYSFDKETPIDTLFSQRFVMNTLPKDFSLEGYEVSANGKYILLQTNTSQIYRHSKKAEFYIYSIAKKKIKQVNKGKQVCYAGFSPDETKVAYVYDNNLYIQYFTADSTAQVTKDGLENNIINGMVDWVYEEEFSMAQGYQWSPAGDKIAYYKFDESKVKLYQLAIYDSMYPTQYQYKYPLAGEDNSKVAVWVYDLKNTKNQKLDLHEDRDQYIPRILWTRENNVLAIERLNREQNYLELLEATAPDWNIKPVLTEKNKYYVDISDDIHFFKDNSFIMTSEKDGYNNIYLYDRNGSQVRNITPYPYDVEAVAGVIEASGVIYYTSKEPKPRKKTIFQIRMDGTDKKQLNSDEKGSNSVVFAGDYKHYIMTSSATMTPGVTSSYNINGEKIRVLVDNKDLAATLEGYNFQPKEYFDVKLSDSITLSGWMIKPADFKKNKKYPVIFSIYGGPGIQTVNDAWSGPQDIWHQYMASKGYIIVSIDNRGTGGKGADFKKTTYKKLGQKESDDQIAAATYFAHQSYVDPARIGIFGWSFGGYMASMCITKGAGVFNTAVAVAPVTDWRFYDNIYTERYMGKPKDNAANYTAGSVLTYVPKLTGNFLVIHGTFDDNVHPQNTFTLLKEMIKLNKKFDSEFYPNKAHSISGGYTRLHLFTRVSDYFLSHL
jgi:dipeptidyl-peptidase-4